MKAESLGSGLSHGRSIVGIGIELVTGANSRILSLRAAGSHSSGGTRTSEVILIMAPSPMSTTVPILSFVSVGF
jgi:hypothetical protein